MLFRSMIPSMVKRGYDVRFAAATQASAAGLAVIIPPSISMILYCVATNVSITNMFVAGVIPGILLGMTEILYAWYLSDIEKDRRNPPEMDKLELISQVLLLSEDEKSTMLDLAGRKRNSVAPDLPGYIMEREYVSAALRTARDLDAGEEEWMKFVAELKKRKG